MKKLALSSEFYLIKASELKRLPRAAEINGNISGSLAASAAPQAFSAATASPQVSSREKPFATFCPPTVSSTSEVISPRVSDCALNMLNVRRATKLATSSEMGVTRMTIA